MSQQELLSVTAESEVHSEAEKSQNTFQKAVLANWVEDLGADNTRHLSSSLSQRETKRPEKCDQKHNTVCEKSAYCRFHLLSKLMPSSCQTEILPHFPCSESQVYNFFILKGGSLLLTAINS